MVNDAVTSGGLVLFARVYWLSCWNFMIWDHSLVDRLWHFLSRKLLTFLNDHLRCREFRVYDGKLFEIGKI